MGRVWASFVPGLLSLLVGACDPGGASTIERQVFVDVYVALRHAELRSRSAVIGDADRDSVLAAHGVDQEDLLAFAEVHGGDAEFMEGVWSEVQDRMADLSR